MATNAALGITLQIGSKDITIDSKTVPKTMEELKKTTFKLPEGNTVSFTITEIVTWFNTTFGSQIPTSFPLITDTNVEINTFEINFATSLLRLGFKVSITGGLNIPGTQVGFKSFSIILTKEGAIVGTPTITGPNSGKAGAEITFTGTNMTGVTAGKIGGVALEKVEVVSDTSVKATIPTGTASGSTSVTFTNALGTGLEFNFTVDAA
ncbi:hypothetical protein [Aquimarina longa]|uniref:hypothetical protein n=1 Tax=Aquimarina longa TaxID=1080221 RepID=UPI000B1E96CC|nr:hypothetical protein [Aquimarina longa]